jgi:hypothetical protein
MVTYGLFLESERCPDGWELAPNEFGLLHFCPRTDRRETFHLEIQNLEDPVVVEFANASDDATLIKFLSRFGSLFHRPPPGLFEKLKEVPLKFEPPRDDILNIQEGYRRRLVRAAGSPVEALQAINEEAKDFGAFDLAPKFDLAGEGGAPRMLLQCRSLISFMDMEIAMVATSGAKLATCKQCDRVFLTGPLTWRRAHAQYCTDRCRVAAMRARNQANAKS